MKKIRMLVAAIVVAISATLTPIALLIGPTAKAGATVPSSWSISTSPNSSTSQYNFLNGVSCVSTTYCTAVGEYNLAPYQTLIESWNGSAWSIVSSPNTSSSEVNYLQAVSCTSASACTAVGYSINGSSNIQQTLIESWNGTAWSIVSSPNTSSTLANYLYGVSCTSASACTAVGYSVTSGGTQQTLIEAWNGTSWSIDTSQNTSSTLGNYLYGVSCTSATSCTAVGFSYTSGSVQQSLIETWNGTSGSIVTGPTSSLNNSLASVSCTSASACTAGGRTFNSAGTGQTLVQSWNGTAWSNVPSPNTGSSLHDWFTAVSCTSPVACTAAGITYNNSSYLQPLVESWNGTTWSINSSPSTSSSQNNWLEAVSCTSRWTCTTAGYSLPGSYYQTLIESSTKASPPYSVTPDGTNPGVDARSGARGADTLCNCATTKPVNLSTGDYYDTQTDLTIPGAGIPLTFNRTYDAEAAQAETTTAASAGDLGYGWTDNLGMSVSYSGGLATVTQANGSQLTFQHYGIGATEPVGSGGATWCPSDATAAVFCPTAPRYIATLSQDGGGNWTFVNDIKSPITYSFTSGGTLSQIADAAGDTLVSAAYSPGTGQATCPSGDTCTAWSSTPSGESTPSSVLVEAFNSSSQLVSVFDAASAAASAQIATFTYSGTGCSTWTGTPQDLCSATDPGSLTTTFSYDTGKSSPYQYDETAMTPPATGQVANTYDASGRITKQVTTTGGTNHEQDFAYATNSTVTNGTQTILTSYPNGTGGSSTTATYLFSNGVEVGVTNGTSATTYVNRDPATLLAADSIDGNGNDTSQVFANYAASGGTPTSSANVTLSTDAMGNMSQALYTSANLPYCTMNAADYAWGQAQSTPVSCPTTPPTTPPTGATGYTTNIYNAANELTSTTDPLGNTTANSYTVSGSGVPVGLLYCTVDPVDYKASVACPAYGAAHVTGTATKTFDANGDVLTSTDANGNTSSFSYGSAANPGLPTTTTDPDGKVTTNTYNAQGEVLTQVVTGTTGTYSATTQFAYDSSGRKFCEVDPYEYSNAIRCPSSPPTTPPTGTPGYTDTIYNSDGQVATTTSPIGGTTQFAYDGSGNKYCTVSPTNFAGGTRCPTTLPLTTPTPSSDSYLGATITTFDADNRVIQVTNPLGGITLSTYDSANNVTLTTVESNNTTNAPNVVTATTYDADNRVISTTAGSGSSSPATTLTSYDPNGNAFCSVSAKAYAAGTSAYQCPAWQPGWIVTPPSPTALYSTTPASAQANNVTTAFFNTSGGKVQTTDPDIQTSVSANDADGRTYCTSDPVNVSSWLTANPSGVYPYLCPSTPPTSAPTGTTGYNTTIFDSAGRTVSQTDQVSDTTAYAYDPAGRKTSVTDPLGKVTTWCYYWQNATGQCAAGAPAGGGSGDDLYSETTPATTADPSGQTTTHTYYPGDEADVITTPAGSTTDTYDSSLDLTGAAYSGTASGFGTPTNLSYSYNPDGSRHTMTDGTGTTTYSIDAMGNVTQQQFSAGSGTGLADKTVAYAYFTTGVLSSITYPTYGSHTSPAATYTYDALGNMASVTDWLSNKVTFAHDGDGNLTSQDNVVSTVNPNGTSGTAFSFDNADLNTQGASTLNCSGTNGTLSQSFSGTGGSRNADGQVTQDSESYSGSCAGPSTYQRNYSYDQAGRVAYQGTVAQGANPNNVSYDASGDPTQISSHDGQGNFDSYTQAFDNAGEAQSQTPISGSLGSSSSYSYDTLGDRTSAVTGSATTAYGYDQLGRMTSTSPNTTSYLYTGDGLEAASKYSAPSWGAATSIDGTHVIESVSCPTSTFCIAVDNAGNRLKYNGTSWGAATNIDGTHVIDSVSCPTSTFCEAVDNVGNALTYNGSGWSAATNIDGTKVLKSVSCASSTFCIAVDNAGNRLKYNGTSWGAATNIDGTHVIDSVSCPSSTFCAAADASGNSLTYNGATWSSAVNIDGTKALQSVSCTSSTLCTVVDNAGDAQSYQTGNVTSQFVWNTNGSLPLTISDGSNDYIYGPTGEPVEQVNTTSMPPVNNPIFMTYTPSDSSWLITNAAGIQTSFYRYDAFGNLAFGTPGSAFGYAGQYQDSATASSGFDNMRARWYDSQTGSFTTRDPAFSQTDQAYAYAGGDPVNRTDPSGLCVSLFNAVCVGGGSVSSTLSFHFNPGAAANATVNIGRGASFGLSDTIANWLSPGASCTVAQNGLDQAIGSAATIVASFGAGSAAETGGAVLKGPIADEVASNLPEQMALDSARAGNGDVIIRNLGDEPRLVANYGPGEWVKMENVGRGVDENVTVHWFRNLTTGQNVQFKFTSRYGG
jgi:RHS repeat-associated protein